MKIENQVCLLPQAKRLKELGVSQRGTFWWKCNTEQSVVICGCTKEMNERYFGFNTWYAAFSCAELEVMLPAQCRVDHHECTLQQCRSGFNNEYYMNSYVTIHYHGNDACKIQYARENEADSRAAMLTHLLENNIITADEVNKRLAG